MFLNLTLSTLKYHSNTSEPMRTDTADCLDFPPCIHDTIYSPFFICDSQPIPLLHYLQGTLTSHPHS